MLTKWHKNHNRRFSLAVWNAQTLVCILQLVWVNISQLLIVLYTSQLNGSKIPIWIGLDWTWWMCNRMSLSLRVNRHRRIHLPNQHLNHDQRQPTLLTSMSWWVGYEKIACFMRLIFTYTHILSQVLFINILQIGLTELELWIIHHCQTQARVHCG